MIRKICKDKKKYKAGLKLIRHCTIKYKRNLNNANNNIV